MMSRKTSMVSNALIVLILLVLAVPAMGLAQDEKDNTGTNPINFTYDYRLYTEMAELYEPNGSAITNTFEFRWPIGRDLAELKGKESGDRIWNMGKEWAGRLKIRYKNVSIDNPESEFGTMEVSGIGDMDARIMWIPYATSKWGVAPGFEAFFNTASNPALGNGVNIMAPTLFFGFFGVLGTKASIFAPGYQYWFDVGGDDDSPKISRSVFDIYMVWILGKGRNWVIVNPQIIVDHKKDVAPWLADFEWGFMIARSVGASGWIRPGVGIGGGHRPFKWNIEAGLKFVWR